MATSGEVISTGRRSSVLGSWRLMLRLARRDLARHRGRAILTALMVALPVMLVSAGGTLLATRSVSGVEAIPRVMGASQARLDVGDARITQNFDGSEVMQGDPTGKTQGPAVLPGAASGETPSAATVQRATGGRLLPVSGGEGRAVLGERRVRFSLLGIDGRNSAYAGMGELVSGRWPSAPGEVLVTERARARGFPTSGRLGVEGGRPLTVVGVADVPATADLVTLPTGPTTTYLLARDTPVRWAEVKRLNAYGITVLSRSLTTDPGDAPRTIYSGGTGRAYSTVSALVVVGVALLTVFLAGPAFTTSGPRHRRALGQIASNGGTAPMLRRYVLAQAVLLGVLAAVVGVVLGAIIGLGLAPLVQRLEPDNVWGPPDLRWRAGLALGALAALSALVAALAPAVVAGRTSVLRTLRGQVSARRVRAGWPVLGVVVVAIGGVLIFSGVRAMAGGEAQIALGGVLMFGGAMVALPWLLAQFARFARHLPLSMRMAARDVGRQRGRALSGVGAIMASVTLLVALSIGAASDDKEYAVTYLPQAVQGEGRIDLAQGPDDPRPDPDAQVVTRAVTGAAPGVRVEQYARLAADTTAQGVVPKGASLVGVPDPRCEAEAKELCWWAGNASAAPIYALTDAQLAALDLPAAARKALQDGGIVCAEPPPTYGMTCPVTGGRSTLAEGVAAAAGEPLVVPATKAQTREVPAATVPSARLDVLGMQTSPGVIVRADVAAQRGWPTEPAWLRLSQPGGIDDATEQAVAEALPSNVSLYVERGYVSVNRAIIWTMTGVLGLIVLVAALVGTALTQAESRSDQATLAAVGAGRGLRRRVAGWQAASIALVGGLTGLVLGLIPGIAVAKPLTSSSFGGDAPVGPFLVIPWESITPVVLGVPLVAALLAAAVTRARPQLARRND